MILKPFQRSALMALPVAFISTISRDGVRNIAPWSCVMPVLRPLDLVAIASAPKRDTLRNIRDTGEFVVNLAGADMIDAVIPTARFSPPEADEFELADLRPKPSETIKAPGIEGCYAWMECQLTQEYAEANYALVLGRILRLEVRDDVLDSDGNLDVNKAKPLLMNGNRKGMNYCTVSELGRSDPLAAMFPDGVDPAVGLYAK
jgi:flavin reductase (DIM6/NTAB) family NADH-FMN oxidoreductase RutF